MTYSEIVRLMRETDELADFDINQFKNDKALAEKLINNISTLEKLSRQFKMVDDFLRSDTPIDVFISQTPVEDIQAIITACGA